jgi:membrane protease YdiL (CAAX protease family)
MESIAPILIGKNARTTPSRRRDWFEITSVYGMVLLVFWTPRPWQDLLWVGAAAVVTAIILKSRQSLQAMGVCKGKLSCWLWALAATLAVAGLAVVLAAYLHTLHLPETPKSFLGRSCLYALWALIQEVVLQCFFLARLLHLIGNATGAAVTTAVLFALAHLPSPILMAITLVCGLAACLFFLRFRTLYPLAIAHAILGLSIAITVPRAVDHNMSVGLAYLTYSNQPAPLLKP